MTNNTSETEYSINEDGLLSVGGRPVKLYHGTNRKFIEHDSERHRSELNHKFQGDWICYSADENVAWKYASAARNQNLDRRIFLSETKQIFSKIYPDPLSKYALQYVIDCIDTGDCSAENGKCYEMILSDIENIESIEDASTYFWRSMNQYHDSLDMNDIVDLTDYVDGTKMGHVDTFTEIHNFLNAKVSSLPYHIYADMEKLGYSQAIPEERLIVSHICASCVLETSNRSEAVMARDNGYDLVIYSGEGTVDGEVEFLINSDSQLRKLQIIEKKTIIEKISPSEWMESETLNVIDLAATEPKTKLSHS